MAGVTALDLEAIDRRRPASLVDVVDLIAEVRKLREIVLTDHHPSAAWDGAKRIDDTCRRCMSAWPCPSALAAGAT